ncbi:hypothetical protein C8J57DRAFT_1493451 [Mycena rebaudengoi]|nr:hypothetical protein C8J57DRAFT_1493451 [Mycena rebaudengoi]
MFYSASTNDAPFTICPLGSHDREIDQALIELAVPDGAEMADYDLNHRSYQGQAGQDFNDIPSVFRRPITTNDFIPYIKDGMRCARIYPVIATELWEALLLILEFILAAGQPTVGDMHKLRAVIPYINFNALQLSYPPILFLKRHSGDNPFYAEQDMSTSAVVQLYHDLQYCGRISLEWIMHASNRTVHRDVNKRWDWDHLRALSNPTKAGEPRGDLAWVLEKRGFVSMLGREYYFAGDMGKSVVENTDLEDIYRKRLVSAGSGYPGDNRGSITHHDNLERAMILHPEFSSYCRAHPSFNPFATHTDLNNLVDASYDNTDALLGQALPPAPPPTPINNPDPSAHCLSGYARAERPASFAPWTLPDGDSDIQMSDVEEESTGAVQMDDSRMALWMHNLHLNSE